MSNNQNNRELSSRCISAGVMASAGAFLGTAGLITGIILLFTQNSAVMQPIAMGIASFLITATYATFIAGIGTGILWNCAGETIARLCQRRQDETKGTEPPTSPTGKILAGTGLVIYTVASFTAAGLATNQLLATGQDPIIITRLAACILGTATGIPLGVTVAGYIITSNNRK